MIELKANHKIIWLQLFPVQGTLVIQRKDATDNQDSQISAR